MISEKVKIGFDGTAVKRGLMGMRKGFSKLGRGIGRVTRQVGIGGARRGGESLVGLAVGAATAVPNEIKALADLSKELDIVTKSTGLSAEKFLALRDAISMATGEGSDEALDTVRDITERLGEAFADGESAPGQALRSLGIQRHELMGEDPVKQLKIISEAFKSAQDSMGMEKSFSAMNELFGEVGKKLVPMLLEFDDAMADGVVNTIALNGQLHNLKGSLNEVRNIQNAFSTKFSEFSLGFLQSLEAGDMKAKSIADFIRGLNVADSASKFAEVVSTNLQAIKQDGLWEWIMQKLADMGKWLKDLLTEAIRDGIKGGLDSINPFKKISGWFSGGGEQGEKREGSNLGIDVEGGNKRLGEAVDKVMNFFKSASTDADQTSTIAQNTARTNQLLERQLDGGTTAIYA